MKVSRIGVGSAGILGVVAIAVLALGTACVSVSVNESDNPSPVTEPGAYTKAFVDKAVERYEDDGSTRPSTTTTRQQA